MKKKDTKEKRTKVVNSDVCCIKCGKFLGMTCDPFRESYCKECFKENPNQ